MSKVTLAVHAQILYASCAFVGQGQLLGHFPHVAAGLHQTF